MSTFEGKQSPGIWNASFYAAALADTDWEEVIFTDGNGERFAATNIQFELDDPTADDPVLISFHVLESGQVRKTQGRVGSIGLVMRGKCADSVFIKRSASADTTVHITAWR